MGKQRIGRVIDSKWKIEVDANNRGRSANLDRLRAIRTKADFAVDSHEKEQIAKRKFSSDSLQAAMDEFLKNKS